MKHIKILNIWCNLGKENVIERLKIQINKVVSKQLMTRIFFLYSYRMWGNYFKYNLSKNIPNVKILISLIDCKKIMKPSHPSFQVLCVKILLIESLILR